MITNLAVRAAIPQDAAALDVFFAACDSRCYCRWFHFEGDKNDWLLRCATAPEENGAELRSCLAQGRDDALGVVAIDGEAIVGWMKVAPKPAVPLAYAQRYYRGLACLQGAHPDTFLLACALIHPAYRKRGLTDALVTGAIALAVSRGARFVEAFPRRLGAGSTGSRDEDLFTLPDGPLARSGFVQVGGEDPYPVLRLELAR